MALNEYDEMLEDIGRPDGELNEYDTLLQDQFSNDSARVQSSVALAQGTTPSRQAEVLGLAQKTGLPAGVVDRQFDLLKKQQAIHSKDYGDIVRNSPGVGKYLSNHDNAALSQNEVDQLRNIERNLKKMRRPQGDEWAEFGEDLSGAFQVGYNNLISSTVGLAPAYGLADIEDVAEVMAEHNRKAQQISLKKPDYAKEWQDAVLKEGRDVGKAFGKWAGAIPKYLEGKKLEAIQDYFEGNIETLGELLDLVWTATSSKEKLKGLAYTTTESAAYSFPSLLTGFAAGKAGAVGGGAIGGPPGAAVGGVGGFAVGTFAGSVSTEVGAWINQEIAAKGYDITNPQDLVTAYKDPALMASIRAEAERKGVATAAVDAMFSMIAGRIKIGKGVTGKVASKAADVGTQMAGEAAGEAAGQVAAKGVEGLDAGEVLMEGLASFGHSVAEIAVSPVTTMAQEAKAEQPTAEPEVKESALRANYSESPTVAMEEVAQDAQDALKTAQQIKALQAIGQQMAELKDTTAVPGKFAELVETASEGLESDRVYFQVDDFENYFKRKGLSAAQVAEQLVEGGAKKLYEAKEAGHHLDLPLGVFLEKTGQTEHFMPLSSIARTTPEGMTLQAAQEVLNELPNLVDSIAREARQKKQTRQDIIEAEASEVAADIEQQLVDSGRYSGKDAKAMASVYRERIKRRADIRGITPRELVAERGMGIQSVDEIEDVLGETVYEQAPRFYSKMQQTIDKKMGGKATVEQVRAIIKDMKAEEVKWSGIDKFLEGKDKVSKDELLEYLRANQIQIVDVTRGGDQVLKEGTTVYRFFDDSGEWLATIANEDNIDSKRAELAEELGVDESTIDVQSSEYTDGETIEDEEDLAEEDRPVRFERYTLPGGENYREVLFTMSPKSEITKGIEEEKERLNEIIEKDKRLLKDATEKGMDLIRALRLRDDISGKAINSIKSKIRFGADIRRTGEQNENQIRAVNEALDLLPDDPEIIEMFQSSVDAWMAQTKHSPEGFQAKKRLAEISEGRRADVFVQAGHFEEENILAHVRLKDRVDADGKKVLFVEEIQSDWHQKGREKGYQGDLVETGWLAFYNGSEVGAFDNREAAEAHAEKWLREMGGEGEILVEARMEPLKTYQAVPDAPFRKTWHEFALKNVLRMAAEGDYDRVAWTTGEQQAERYDLSKQISEIHYSGTNLKAYGLNGETVMSQTGVQESELPDYIGKEAADKLLAQPKEGTLRSLVGQDLKVGGEGMKGFYDQILVRFANKFVKKYGAKVGVTNLLDKIIFKEPRTDVIEIVLSDFGDRIAQRGASDPDESVQWDSSDLATAISEAEDFADVDRLYNEASPKLKAVMDDAGYASLPRERLPIIEDVKISSTKEKIKVHSLDLTPELKDAALTQGFELFQETKGRIRIGKAEINIDLFKDADISTMIHETSHAWLEEMRLDYEAITAIEGPLTIEQTQFIRDVDTVLTHFGVGSFEDITVEMHEEWARLGEAYFMEGKSPSEGLRKVFARFKTWLITIYKSLTSLNVEMSKDIREVFNRLIAAQDEVAEMMGEQNLVPLLPPDVMTDSEAKKYYAIAQEAQAAAEEILTQKFIDDWQREKQSWWKEKRDEIKQGITEQVNEMRVYKALENLRYGKTIDGSSMKLSRKALIVLFGADYVKALPKPFIYTRDGGLNPEIAASMMGYESIDEMLDEIVAAPKKKELINTMTDARMGELYPNMFADSENLKDEAMTYVHNTKQEEMLLLELDYLARAETATFKGMTKRLIRRLPTTKQIRREVERTLGRTPVDDIRPHLYLRAEAKASKEAADAWGKGDISAAFEAKRRQIVNFQLYREAMAAKEKIAKAKKRFKKLNQSDEKLAKSRDINLILAARAVLSTYGIGQADKTAEQYLEPIREYDPEAYSTIIELVKAAEKPASKPLSAVTYDDFIDLDLAIESLWDLSKQSRTIEINGQKHDITEARSELIEELTLFKKPGKKVKYDKAATKWDRFYRGLLGIKAMLRRTEHWVDAMDGGNPEGVFRKFIWSPVNEASDLFTETKGVFLNKFKDLLEGIDLGENPIQSDELGYEFKNKGEILGAMLHVGNDSNKTKLLVGRGWGDLREDGTLDTSRWDAFIQRMHDQGVVTKAEWDFVQATWDLMEELKPMAQRAHKELFGFYFSEITSNEFETPFGMYRGGYAPAAVDTFIVQDVGVKKAQEEIVNGNNSFAYPTAGGKGFTKSRQEAYHRPLQLDIRLFGQHLDQVLRFSIIKPRVTEVARLILNPEFADAMQDIDAVVINNMLRPYLQRADKQLTQNPIDGPGAKQVNRAYSYLRTGIAMQIMFANFGNVVEQATGFLVASSKLPLKYIRNGVFEYLRAPAKITQEISAQSKYMASRFDNQVYELTKATDDILDPKGRMEQARNYAIKNMYVFQQAFQNVLDASIWHGAFMHGLDQGLDDRAAGQYADSVVRQTQGSMRPIDISGVEANPWVRAFQMFYGYFNMLANTSVTEYTKLVRSELSLKQKYARGIYAYTMVIGAPAIISALIKAGMAGTIDEDDDDEYLDNYLDIFFGSQVRTVTAMFPFVGPAVQAGFNKYNDKWYDDRISASPALNAIPQTIEAPLSVYKAMKGEGSRKKAIRDVFNSVGVMTGTPVGVLARPLGYLSDIQEGKAQPTGPIDFTRGIITGKPGGQ